MKYINSRAIGTLKSDTSDEFVGRLLLMYLEELAVTHEELGSVSDRNKMLRTLHKAKNSAATFGADPLREAILVAEETLREGQPLADKDIKNLLGLADATLKELNKFIDNKEWTNV